MSKPRLLDAYCGAGGATRGYQEAGFYVVGVDIKPQPRYIGDEFFQGDAINFIREHGHEFDAIHASPPCEGYCRLKHQARNAVDLIGPTREALVKTGKPYVIENVPGSPLRASVVLCGTMFGLRTPCGAELWRHRLFELNWSLSRLAPPCAHYSSGRGGRRERVVLNGHVRTIGTQRPPVITVTVHGIGVNVNKRVCTVSGTKNKPGRENTRDSLCFSNADRAAAMQIDWMTGDSLVKAIPPAYTKWLGEQLIEVT